MIEALQTEDCLNSQTCCEGTRRPSWTERNRADIRQVIQEDYTPERAYNDYVWPKMPISQEVEDPIKTFAEAACEVNEVIQERMSLYGPPSVNLDCIARHWQAYLDNRNSGPLTLQDVCNMMCLAKLSRMARTPEHADSVKDIKAYRQIAETAGH